MTLDTATTVLDDDSTLLVHRLLAWAQSHSDELTIPSIEAISWKGK